MADAVYIGPLVHPRGKLAITRPSFEDSFVLAQFDDLKACRRPGVSVELDPARHAKLRHDALGFGWHVFEARHFAAKSPP